MEKWAMWVAGALFSVTYALIWRLYDAQDARAEWGRATAQEIRTDMTSLRIDLLRELSQLERVYADDKVALQREIATLTQRQGLDEERWGRTLRRSPDQAR